MLDFEHVLYDTVNSCVSKRFDAAQHRLSKLHLVCGFMTMSSAQDDNMFMAEQMRNITKDQFAYVSVG